MTSPRRAAAAALALSLAFVAQTAGANGPASALVQPAAPAPGESPLERLKSGNLHFAEDKPVHPHQSAARRAELLGAQKPFATVLSCSDSRVPAELAFDQGLGDIFVVRVAGNVADTDELGTVEYGVDHLETPVLVVLGHTKCGAVTAVVKHAEVHGHIPELVDNIKPAVDAALAKAPGAKEDELVPLAIRENVFVSMADIITKSHLVRERLKAGKVEIVGGIYHLDDGKVDWLGHHPDEKELIAKGDASPKEEAHGHDAPADGHAKKKPHAKKPKHEPKSDEGHGEHAGAAASAAGDHGAGEHGAVKPGHDDHRPPVNLPTLFAIVAFVATIAGVITGRLTSR
jgi:carbonic anhydrase